MDESRKHLQILRDLISTDENDGRLFKEGVFQTASDKAAVDYPEEYLNNCIAQIKQKLKETEPQAEVRKSFTLLVRGAASDIMKAFSAHAAPSLALRDHALNLTKAESTPGKWGLRKLSLQKDLFSEQWVLHVKPEQPVSTLTFEVEVNGDLVTVEQEVNANDDLALLYINTSLGLDNADLAVSVDETVQNYRFEFFCDR